MKERPILLKDEMVRAILEGRKTQTRRMVKPQPTALTSDGLPFAQTANDESFGRLGKVIACPYGQPGDRLWVRETFTDEAGGIWPYLGEHISYRADPLQPLCERWTPSIHMPRWASRITLEITSVRVERLQSISYADAQAEGVQTETADPWFYHITTERNVYDFAADEPQGSFRKLWESINGPGSWAANPWVWVVEFKRVLP